MNGDRLTLLSIICAGCVSISFVVIALKQRALFLKPSMQVLLYSHVILQWPAALRASEIQGFLPRPEEFFIVLNGFVVLGLVGSALSFGRDVSVVASRVTGQTTWSSDSRVARLVLGATVAGVFIHYLSVVPLERTGLVAILKGDGFGALAREESLKLLDSRFTKYAFSITAASLAPLLGVIMAGRFVMLISTRRVVAAAGNGIALVVLLVLVSLTGARGYSALFMLALFAALVIQQGIRIRPLHVVAGATIALLPAVAISIYSIGANIELLVALKALGRLIEYRIFSVPLEVSLWYVHYAQTMGPMGIGAIPKVAALVGVPEINAPNVIGLYYFDATLWSVNANTGYLFSYFGYFGPVSLVGSVVLLWVLDWALVALRLVNDALLLPTLAVLSVNALSLIQTEYTVAMITNGFAVTVVVAIIISGVSNYMKQVVRAQAR